MAHCLPFHASKHKCPCISKRGVRCKEWRKYEEGLHVMGEGGREVNAWSTCTSIYSLGCVVRACAHLQIERWEWGGGEKLYGGRYYWPRLYNIYEFGVISHAFVDGESVNHYSNVDRYFFLWLSKKEQLWERHAIQGYNRVQEPIETFTNWYSRGQ